MEVSTVFEKIVHSDEISNLNHPITKTPFWANISRGHLQSVMMKPTKPIRKILGIILKLSHLMRLEWKAEIIDQSERKIALKYELDRIKDKL